MMDSDDKTPLHHAISHLMVDAVRYLLACKGDDGAIDLDAVSRRRETPLMRCAQMGQGGTDIAELLIQAGADVNKTADKEFVDFNRQTALHVAASLNNVGVMGVLVNNKTNKANLEATDIDNRTPLFLAAANGHKDSVMFLLDSGARPEHTDSMDKDAAVVAAENGYEALAEVINDKKGERSDMMRHIGGHVHPSRSSHFPNLPAPSPPVYHGVPSIQQLMSQGSRAKNRNDENRGGGEVAAKRPRIMSTKNGGGVRPISSHLPHPPPPPISSVGPSPPTLTPPNSDQSTSAHSNTPSPNHGMGLVGAHLHPSLAYHHPEQYHQWLPPQHRGLVPSKTEQPQEQQHSSMNPPIRPILTQLNEGKNDFDLQFGQPTQQVTHPTLEIFHGNWHPFFDKTASDGDYHYAVTNPHSSPQMTNTQWVSSGVATMPCSIQANRDFLSGHEGMLPSSRSYEPLNLQPQGSAIYGTPFPSHNTNANQPTQESRTGLGSSDGNNGGYTLYQSARFFPDFFPYQPQSVLHDQQSSLHRHTGAQNPAQHNE